MTDEQERIAELQKAWMQAWVDRDIAACERVLAPEFRLRSVATDDVVDRANWLREVEAGRGSVPVGRGGEMMADG